MDCNATFVDCNFTNNKATGWGNGNGYAGAIYASGSIIIIQSTDFTGNSADLEGGAIFAENTDLNSTNCVFRGIIIRSTTVEELFGLMVAPSTT